MFKKIVLYSFFTVLGYSSVATQASIENAANQGCTHRYPNTSSFDIQITSSTILSSIIYDGIDYCTDVDYSQTVLYDLEVDRVRAVTGCTLEHYTENDLDKIRSIVETSLFNFTCGGCQAPQGSTGNTYQFYPNFTEAECTTQNLYTLYAEANPSSVYEIEDAQWIDCFGEGSSQNGCYYSLRLKDTSETNSTDTNSSTSTDNNTGTSTTTDTSQDLSSIESLLSDIKTNTGNSAHELSFIKSFAETLADPDFDMNGSLEAYQASGDADKNQSSHSAKEFLNDLGIDRNETSGNYLDIYGNYFDDMLNGITSEILSEDGNNSISTIMGNAFSKIMDLGARTNPFLLFETYSASAKYDPMIFKYNTSLYSWEITVNEDQVFSIQTDYIWFLVRLFLLFFTVLHCYLNIVERIDG